MNKLQVIKKIVMLVKQMLVVNKDLKVEYAKQIRLAFIKLVK